MKKLSILFIISYCLLGPALVSRCEAAIYKYVDKDGVVCFADDLQAVPEKYRSRAIIIQGELRDDAAKDSNQLTAGNADEHVPRRTSPSIRQNDVSRGPLSYRLMVSAGVCLAALLIFGALAKQSELRENKKALSLIRTSIIGIVSIYIVMAHANDVMSIFTMAGNAVDEVQRRSEEKGKKAAQTIKAIDNLFEQAQQAEKAQEAAIKDVENDKDR